MLLKLLAAATVLLGGIGTAHAAFEREVFYTNFEGAERQSGEVKAVVEGGVLFETKGLSPYGFADTFYTLDHRTMASEITLTLSDLPTHTHLSIGGLLAIINSWDGDHNTTAYNHDLLSVMLDGAPLITTTFTMHRHTDFGQKLSAGGAEPLFSFSTENPGWGEQVFDFTNFAPLSMIAHTGSTATFTFLAHGSGWQARADESFGLDNLMVVATNTNASANLTQDLSAPAGGVIALFGLLFAGLRTCYLKYK